MSFVVQHMALVKYRIPQNGFKCRCGKEPNTLKFINHHKLQIVRKQHKKGLRDGFMGTIIVNVVIILIVTC